MSTKSTNSLTSLKLSFNGEIRRLTVATNGLTYEDLMHKTLSVFPNLTSIQFSWVDDEGDKVIISSNEELSEALRVMASEKKGYLRFEVLATSSEGKASKTQTQTAAACDTKMPATSTTPSVKAPNATFGIITHDGIICDGCGESPLTGSRFKCAVREDYDLCTSCEASAQQPYPMVKIYRPDQVPAGIMVIVDEGRGPHHSGRFGAPEGPGVLCHRGVICNGCRIRNFHGPRFKCTVRDDYDLCEACEAKDGHGHVMVKIYPQHARMHIQVVPNNKFFVGANVLPYAAAQFRQSLIELGSPGRRGPHHGPAHKGPAHHGPPHHGPHHHGPHHHGPHHHGPHHHGPPHHGPHHHGPPHHGPPHHGCGGWRRKGRNCWDRSSDCWDRRTYVAQAAADRAKHHAAMKEKEKREHKAKEDSRLEDDLLEMCIKESLLEKERLGLETTTALPSEPDFGRRKGQRRGGGRHCWDRSAIAQAAATRAQHHAAVKEVEQFENATKEQSHSNEQLSPTVQSSTVGGCPAWERVGVAKAAATRAQVHTAVKEVEQFEIQSKEVKTEENLEAKNKPTTLSSLLAESVPPTPPPKLMARFVRDVSMPDGSEIAPHSTFFKTWRVRNDGKGDWPEGCHLVSAGGDRLLDAKLGEDYVLRQPVPVAAAGEEIELTLELCAPDATGRHVGYFRLENPEGSYFGQRLWADIRVNDADMSMSMTLTPWEVVDSSTDDKQQEEEKEVNEEEGVSTVTTVTPDVEQSIEEVLQKSNDNAVLSTEDDRDRLLEETPLLQEHQQEQQEQFDAELALWSKELRVLSAMGFHDLEQLLPLLKAHITVPASTRDVGTEEPGSESGLQAVVLALLSGQE